MVQMYRNKKCCELISRTFSFQAQSVLCCLDWLLNAPTSVAHETDEFFAGTQPPPDIGIEAVLKTTSDRRKLPQTPALSDQKENAQFLPKENSKSTHVF